MNLSITTRILTSKVKWLCSFLLVLSFSLVGQNDPLSFLFVGDVMQHDGQIEAAANPVEGGYDYDDGFKYVSPIIKQYDLRIANLEVTLGGKPFKGYPQFSAPDVLARTLVSSGFNVIITANNHSCDRGTKGVIRTLDQLDSLGVLHTGTFRNPEERAKNYPLIIEEKGMRVALLNYTYGTNGLTVAAPVIVNYIDSAVIRKDVERAKELNADYIICTMHWGSEYKFLPNSYQKRFESYCYDLGVDMVIGGHPHVVQPIERKMINGEEKLTVWSLGNFVSNMQTRPTRGGLMVGASIQKDNDQIILKDAEYFLVYTLKRNEGKVTQYYILPDFDYNKYDDDFIDATNRSHYTNFNEDSRKLFEEHNKGVEEMKIDAFPEIERLYENFLSGYYAIEIEGISDSYLTHEVLGPMIYQTVDKEGHRHIVSGASRTLEDLRGTKNYFTDLGIGQVNTVYIKNGEVNVIVE